MKLGIVGLPNVGKSTLFNAISNAGAQAANYPFCTIEPNIGTVAVPDSRLDWLADYYSPKKYTPATIEFVDIAGLVRGASKGEGLGNKFLENIRQCDAIIHVVRCFDSTEIIHVDGSVDPIRDIETVNYELLLSDIEILSRRIDKTSKAVKGDRTLASELEFLNRLSDFLNEGNNARAFEVSESDRDLFNDIPLLSAKP
ncbi:MAG: redox-regulated ATPase YchF, partial [Oscillospiraceae bacterium]|nr:redox-regulated ATPase YchF [Oscillospiraceae bacterium]